MTSTLYIEKLRQLLTLEYEAEKEDFRVQSEKMSIRRKLRRGICWFPLSIGRSYYNSLNQLVVEVEKAYTEDSDIDTMFEYGRPVQFFRIGQKPSAPNATRPAQDATPDTGTPMPPEAESVAYFPFASTVSFVDGDRMVCTLPSSGAYLDLQAAGGVGVQLYFDETSYRTMFHALEAVLKARNNRLADLRDIFAGLQPTGRLSLEPMAFPWLNATQQDAVNEVLRAKDVEVVHGPPGTGKTTTLVEAIYETLRRETQVLVCAQSNMAVDWISEQLVDHGVPVLRIGNPTRVNDKMLSFTYERRFESHPSYPELWAIRNSIRQIREHRKSGDNTHQKLSRLRERAAEIEVNIRTDLFNEARVVSATLVGSANKLLVGHHFSTLFIDEAAQALEPACWIAIRRASRVVLAGDHQQLPPTIKCYEALRQGLGKTLMERIVENQPQAVRLLGVQYRMNDAIMQFSNHWFYDGKLKSDPSVEHRSILDLDTPISWIDSDFREEYIGETHGRINKEEAQLLIATLKDYVRKIGLRRFLDERLDVGIISPYRVQTQYIRSLLKADAELKPLRRAIAVNTVDGFQGQERDIIIISLVRSNEQGQIGFLGDLRRMNVAMTRARMKLIILGNQETLSHSAFYRKLFEYIRKV